MCEEDACQEIEKESSSGRKEVSHQVLGTDNSDLGTGHASGSQRDLSLHRSLIGESKQEEEGRCLHKPGNIASTTQAPSFLLIQAR